MKCKMTDCRYKGQTSEPDGICGFCKIRQVLGDYMNGRKAREFVKNMGQGALGESKVEFLDSYRGSSER